MDAEKQRELFEECCETSAVFQLAFPAVVGQIILVVYNMADTFFVGLTGDDAMLASITVCMPAFMFLSAISNLYGVGGASVIARALGAGDRGRVRAASSFAFWGCLVTSLCYALFAFLLLDRFVDILGGSSPKVHAGAASYLLVTVVMGGPFAAVGMLMSHLIRSEGRSGHAGIGIALGGILNIALDPLFMFVILPPGQETLGAALATTVSNGISLLYFIAVLYGIRRKSQLAFRFSLSIFFSEIPRSVFTAGLSACIMTLFENISYAVLDKLMSLEGLAMQAGIGVAKKVNMLAHCMVRGIAQGSLPLIGYNYSAGNGKRMYASVKAAQRMAVGLAGICMIAYLISADSLIGVFIHSRSLSHQYGTIFLRILCIGGPFSASAYTFISFFQATGEGKKSFLLAVLRKGMIDIPLMFVLRALIPVFGIVFATPITDAVCCAAANILFAFCTRKEREHRKLIRKNNGCRRNQPGKGGSHGRHTLAVTAENRGNRELYKSC